MDEQEAKRALVEFTETLRNAGIRTVSVSYSGCGDEGRTEDPQLEDVDGKPAVDDNLLASLPLDDLRELLERFAPEGYGDGEGGYGTITFEVSSGKIRVQHNWYETVSHAEEPREI